MNTETNTKWLKKTAIELGFTACGIAKAEKLYAEEEHLASWLEEERHGEMQYMANNFEKRLDPTLLVDNAKTVVSLLFNYYQKTPETPDNTKVSIYAAGDDYHIVIKQKLTDLLQRIQEKIGDVHGRCFVDSAPVLERAWAVKTGLGWIGKNSMLITKKQGSYFFLAELIIDLELKPDTSIATNHCGTCTACIDACPTNAILPNKKVDAQSCISYYTIELKKNLDENTKSWNNWIFGCDVCQQVCPWNRFSILTNEPTFAPYDQLIKYKKSDWLELTEDVFKKTFRNSPLKRSGLSKIKNNLMHACPV